MRLYLECRLSYSPRAIIVLFASVLRECPVREDVNPILRGGEGDLEEASGTGGATLWYILFFTYVTSVFFFFLIYSSTV